MINRTRDLLARALPGLRALIAASVSHRQACGRLGLIEKLCGIPVDDLPDHNTKRKRVFYFLPNRDGEA